MTPIFANLFIYNLDTVSLYYSGMAGHIIEIENSIYFRNFQGTHKIYNFNINFNDTIIVDYPLSSGENRFVVTEVDTIFVAEQNRKRIFLQRVSYPDDVDIWVEGIGSVVFGFLSPGLSNYITDWYSDPLCFRANPNVPIYQIDTLFQRCFLELQVGTCESQSDVVETDQYSGEDFSMWQVKDELYFHSQTQQYQINIYDNFGRLIHASVLNDEKEFVVSCQNWATGIYIVQLAGKTGVVQSKLMSISR